jgi:hypothetical protein
VTYIGQDEEMMLSIEKDLVLREKKISVHYVFPELKLKKIKRQPVQNHGKIDKIIRKTTQHTKQKSQYLLE